jgi:putative ubiquitin-RnfH superfamily antitoxin RatB of RatAB toxin-antitoxin module
MSVINVEVVYATAEKQTLLTVEIPENSTVKTAILKSGILTQYPELELENLTVGIFSTPCTLEKTLTAGDRVEIYRPLLVNPKEMRRSRAAGLK